MGKVTRFLFGATGFLSSFGGFTHASEITQGSWGNLPDGSEVTLFTLRNDAGLTVRLAEYGALLVSVDAPDRVGKIRRVTLSYESLAEALAGGVYGSVIGRFANRIAGGGFTIDGTRYELTSVDPKSGVHIHGGKTGFHRQWWRGTPLPAENAVRFELTSPAGHEGYPGEVRVSVTYSLSESNELSLAYEATTTAPTHVNLTNHVYWNLAGSGDIANHVLSLSSDEMLALDDRKIPTGELTAVAGTIFDFRSPHPIGIHLHEVEDGGYDHCYLVRGERNALRPCAVLSDPLSGRTLTVSTTQPGVQLYTANHLKDNPFARWGGVCLETQAMPNAPNEPSFPSSLLRPGDLYANRTVYAFGVIR